MEEQYKKIETISNVNTVYYATDNKIDNETLIKYLKDDLEIELTIINDISEIIERDDLDHPDIFFTDQKIQGDSNAGLKICHHLRSNNYQGILILCIQQDPYDEVSSSLVTGMGFDNFLPVKCSLKVMLNQIHWAILNRRRKNKNILQFDNNPDSLFTIDKSGFIHDINETATMGSPYSPKEIVIKRVDINKVGTLPTFETKIKPLIEGKNVNRFFEHTYEDSGNVYQVKVLIKNLPVIGLVATVFKTNITHVMITRTLDIMTNSLTLLGQRDYYTAGHSARVFYYCLNIAEKMGHTPDSAFVKNLYCAALLHDVGKIGVKDEILLKPGKLSIPEFQELATHPVKAFNMLKKYSLFEGALEFIKHHHERPDGRGYPDKLRGKKIPLGAAIIAVADSFDAMTSNRPYRNSLNYKKAIDEVKIYSGLQFDKDVAEAFLSIINQDLLTQIVQASHRSLELITKEIIALLEKGTE